jgi:hypothetical protein
MAIATSSSGKRPRDCNSVVNAFGISNKLKIEEPAGPPRNKDMCEQKEN